MLRSLDSVRGHVATLLLGMALLVTVVAGAGAVGVGSLADDVHVLTDHLRPAAYKNITLRNDMDRARADARGLVLSGEREFLRDYQRSVARARSGMEALRTLTEGDEALRRAVDRQDAAVTAWLSSADRLVTRDPGRVPAVTLKDSDFLFYEFVEVNEAISAQVNDAVDRRGREARGRAPELVGFVVLVSFLGLGATALIGAGLVRRLSGPLRDMERGVGRLAAGDLDARVSTEGPREIREVASALNTLAEENQRAREMEERAVMQLRQLDRAKDEFVSTVSHELRTPLTSISGYIELFEDGLVDDLSPQQRGMLGAVRRNVVRLRALIEDLLTLSRVESDAFRTSFELVDLSRLTRDVARDVAQIAARADVRVCESTPDGPLAVRGDAGQLSRAALNLLSNAIKFSPAGSDVLIRLEESGGRAVLSVVDHGIGIPAAELPTLGTRFFRASNAVEAEITGTGLGLRIVQTVADNHGGRLELESAEGRGTTARLLLPVARDQETGNNRPLQDITEG